MTEEKYDVVIATLQETYDRLWKMTQGNMNSDCFNIMDTIRLEQMDQLKDAMVCWKKYKHEWEE
jgi:hypothetical protein